MSYKESVNQKIEEILNQGASSTELKNRIIENHRK